MIDSLLFTFKCNCDIIHIIFFHNLLKELSIKKIINISINIEGGIENGRKISCRTCARITNSDKNGFHNVESIFCYILSYTILKKHPT